MPTPVSGFGLYYKYSDDKHSGYIGLELKTHYVRAYVRRPIPLFNLTKLVNQSPIGTKSSSSV